MTATIPALLEPIRATLAAATPGPWKADVGVRGDCVVWGPNGRFLMNAQAEPHWLEYPGEIRKVSFDVDRRDAAFIASAPVTVARLLAAVEAVEDLARVWTAKGEHDMAYSKTIPDEDIAMELLTHGAEMVENARILRTAVIAALGGER